MSHFILDQHPDHQHTAIVRHSEHDGQFEFNTESNLFFNARKAIESWQGRHCGKPIIAGPRVSNIILQKAPGWMGLQTILERALQWLDDREMTETIFDFSDTKFSDRQHVASIWSQWFPEGSVSAPRGKKILVVRHPADQDPIHPCEGVQFFTSIISSKKVGVENGN